MSSAPCKTHFGWTKFLTQGELTREGKRYRINRSLAREDKKYKRILNQICIGAKIIAFVPLQKDIVCAKCLFSINFQCIVLTCINNLTLQIKMLNRHKKRFWFVFSFIIYQKLCSKFCIIQRALWQHQLRHRKDV